MDSPKKRFFLILFISLILYTPLCFADELTEDVAAKYYEALGEQFFNSREIPGNLEKGLKFYQKAYHLRPKGGSINWKIARANWYLGREASQTNKKVSFIQEGIKYGKQAILADKNNSNAHLWYALSLGSNALEVGVMKLIYQREEIKSSLKKSLELNPKQTRAFLGLAAWNFAVPEVFGGSESTALSLLEKAVKNDPNLTATYLLRGQYFIKTGNREKAITNFNKILQIHNPTSPSGSIYDKATARNQLAKLKS